MSCRWEYQRDQQQEYRHNWNRDNRAHIREYQQSYREAHPEENRERNRKDVATFMARHPERWKEIHTRAYKAYRKRQQAQRIVAQKGEQHGR